MILALVAAATALLPSRVVEVVDTASPVVSAHALVPVPELGAHDRAVLDVLAAGLAEDTETYGREQWRRYAGDAGSWLHIDVMPDHVDIWMDVLPADVKTAVSFLHAIVRRAKLPDAALSKAIEELPFRHRGFINRALMPEKLDYGHIRRYEVVELYQRMFRPETVTIAVGGPVQPGEAQATWNALAADWVAPRLRSKAPDRTAARSIDRLDADVSVVDLRGPEFVAGDVALPTRLLALVAIGNGKGSSLFRVVRQKHGWTYLQSAVLWPTPKGFMPRLLTAHASSDGLEARAEEIRSELLADVKGWTVADLDRARGMARAILTWGLEDNPLYWQRPWPLTASIEDRTFLAGYWAMKTGGDWDPARLLDSMGRVTLEEMQRSATDLLAAATARILKRG